MECRFSKGRKNGRPTAEKNRICIVSLLPFYKLVPRGDSVALDQVKLILNKTLSVEASKISDCPLPWGE